MPDPAQLLDAARLLASSAGSPPSEARLRRAVSTAYYALFHTVLRAAAERFMGDGKQATPGYALLYRGFEHGQMRRICEELDKPTLAARFRGALGKDSLSADARDFVRTFPGLQQLRHVADYVPAGDYTETIANDTIAIAADAMAAFDKIAPDEQADLLALLLVGARST